MNWSCDPHDQRADPLPAPGRFATVDLPSRLENERPKLIDGLLAGAQAVVDHFGLGQLAVEQRVVLTHPEGQVKKYRSQSLGTLIADLTP